MVVHRSTLKQVNRPFKGSSKSKSVKKVKITAKIELVRLPRRKVISDIKKAVKQSRLRLKQLGPKAILVVSCNGGSLSNGFVERVTGYIQEDCMDFESNIVLDEDSSSISRWNIGRVVQLPKKVCANNISQEVYFYSSPRDVVSVLSAATVADIIILLFDGLKDDDAYDQQGYDIMRALKLQGIPSVLGLNVSNSGSNVVKRYFTDELGPDKKFFTLKDIYQLLRCVASMNCKQVSWRKDRGYMLGQYHSYNKEEGRLVVKGYMKNMGFTCKNMVHVTDVGDFVLDRLEVLPEPRDAMSLDPIVLDQVDVNAIRDQMEVLNEVAEQDDDLEYQKLDEMFDNIAIESNENDELDEYFKQIVNESKNYEMEIRDPKDRTFPDEVDIPSDILASKRFRKYRVLEDFNRSEWDPYMDLPINYSKIHEFESYKRTLKYYNTEYYKNSSEIIENIKSVTRVNTNEPFVYLHITNINSTIVESFIRQNKPFILSPILPYERKVTVLEMALARIAPLKIKENSINEKSSNEKFLTRDAAINEKASNEKNADDEISNNDELEEILSKSEYKFISGFKRFLGKPIFSVVNSVNLVGKSRYLKAMDNGRMCIASIYGFAMPSSYPVIMMKDNEIIAQGNVMGPNPKRVILKRIVLTGYPIKVHKQKAIVRYMFFNPHDIRWYKPAKLVTKKGLSGKIISSLGTHGYMKCQFNQYISQDDIVMLYLYKRVYPKWFPCTWTYS